MIDGRNGVWGQDSNGDYIIWQLDELARIAKFLDVSLYGVHKRWISKLDNSWVALKDFVLGKMKEIEEDPAVIRELKSDPSQRIEARIRNKRLLDWLKKNHKELAPHSLARRYWEETPNDNLIAQEKIYDLKKLQRMTGVEVVGYERDENLDQLHKDFVKAYPLLPRGSYSGDIEELVFYIRAKDDAVARVAPSTLPLNLVDLNGDDE